MEQVHAESTLTEEHLDPPAQSDSVRRRESTLAFMASIMKADAAGFRSVAPSVFAHSWRCNTLARHSQVHDLLRLR